MKIILCDGSGAGRGQKREGGGRHVTDGVCFGGVLEGLRDSEIDSSESQLY